MDPFRLESLPQEIQDMFAGCLVAEPATPLSEYFVPARTTPVAQTRIADARRSMQDLTNVCHADKNLLNITRRHLYSHVVITSDLCLYRLFRTMVMVPQLADSITSIETTIPLDQQIGPNSHYAPVLEANPLLALQFYEGVHPGKSAIDFARERLKLALMDDRVFQTKGLQNLITPMAVFFLGILALAKNLKTLTIGYYQIYTTSNPFDLFVEGRAQLICSDSVNNSNGQGPAPLQKLETIRFRRFLQQSLHHNPNDVPKWLAFFMKLPQVTTLEIAGLTQPQLDANVPIIPNGLLGILTAPQVTNLTRLELVFDLYAFQPIKSLLSPVLLGMRNTLKHLSVVFLGDNSYQVLELTGLLANWDNDLTHDRIQSLPQLTKLEHLEVDLHSLFGWARVWSLYDAEISTQFPERANSVQIRDVIPKTSLKSLHLIESFTDLNIFLNIGAPANTTHIGYINGPLANLNLHVPQAQRETTLLNGARTMVFNRVFKDLLFLIKKGEFPTLKKFVYTPITHARVAADPRYDDGLLSYVQDFAEAGVEMEIVYAGQLGRICQ